MKIMKKLVCFIIISVMLFSNIITVAAFENSNETDITPMAINFIKYVPTSQVNVVGNKIAVTPLVTGQADISYGESVTITSSFSATLTSGEISAVLEKIGASYTRSVASNKNFGVKFTVKEGETKRVYFEPTLLKTSGTIENWRQLEGELNPKLISSKTSGISFVIQKVNGFAEGRYFLDN